MIVVDGHADLAYNILTFGRDYTRAASETRRLEQGGDAPRHNGETLLGWPDWVRGRVAVVFATLFASPERKRRGPWDTQSYTDAAQAHQICSRQLDLYHRLTEQRPDRFRLLTSRNGLAAHLTEWRRADSEPPLGLVVLMEGADGVRAPDEVEQWHRRGVRILGPAWSGTRYAGGTGEPGPLTAQGRALLESMADLDMILDLSHLAEEAAREALASYRGVVIASHSNPRRLMTTGQNPDRHLSDEVLRGLADRGGVVGIVPYNRFLQAGWRPGDGRRSVPLRRVADHIDYVSQLVGKVANLGLGTDFDGGFGLGEVPDGLDTVADLRLIGEVLQDRGYRPEEVEAVLGGNWLDLLSRSLPEE